MGAKNEWKKKCVGLRRTKVSRRTVYKLRNVFLTSIAQMLNYLSTSLSSLHRVYFIAQLTE